MEPSQSRNRIKKLFSETIALAPQQREEFLDRACANDPAIRNEIERLLTAFDDSDAMLTCSSVGEFLRPDGAEPNAIPLGCLVVDRFRIVKMIGRGGMGEVYEAEDLQLGGKIALKTIRADMLARPDLAARFQREIRLARKVTHPNVCRIFDVGQHRFPDAEVPFVTMELLAGETLYARLRSGPMSPGEVLRLIRQIAEGLGALHQARVIHRDLKPANIVLVPAEDGPRCVITDFGLAHNISLEPVHESLTIAGQILGTPRYMSPEQLTGKTIGPPADIYSLAVVMYEMLCGRRPFEAENVFESAAQKLAGHPEPPGKYAELDPRWNTLVLACLERDPAARPQSAGALIAALDQIEREPGHGILPSPAKPGALRLRRYALPLAFSIVFAGLASAVFFTPVAAPVSRQLCRQFPGSVLFCALPADKDIALLPFQIRGSSPENKVLAAGFARHFRESFNRLAPDPGSMCVHLRTDGQSHGMTLVLEGEVEALAGGITVGLQAYEASPKPGSSKPLLLRKVTRRLSLNDAAGLYQDGLLDLAHALDLRYPEPQWSAWSRTRPARSESLVSYLRGLGYLETGEYERAAQPFTEVIDPTRDFTFAPAHVGLAEAFRLRGNSSGDPQWGLRARQAIQRAAVLDRDYSFAGAERQWGELEAGLGSSEAAIEHLSAALRLWPFDHPAQKSLAAAYEAANQPDRAEAVFQDAARRAPRCWLTHSTLANFYSRHARFREAELSLIEAIRLAPDNAAIYHNLAFDYIKAGRVDDAIEMASKSIELRPHPRSYSTLGRAFLYKGCPSDAVVNLRKAVELAADDYVVEANLAEGINAGAAGKRDAGAFLRAVELCSRTLEKNPAEPYALAQRAVNLARLGRIDEALAQSRSALALSPASQDILLLAAETFETAGRRQEALDLLAKGLRNRLSLHEVEFSSGLAGLRHDHAFTALIRRLGLNPAADPGGLVPRPSKACPAWGTAGKGLRPL